MPAKDRPFLQRALIQMLGLVREIFFEQRDHALVAGGLLELREGLEHDVIRPPVCVLGRTDPAFRLLVIERPIHPLVDFRDQHRISGEVGERNQAVQEIRASLPTFASAAQPAAVFAQVGPEFVDVSAEPAGLDAELFQQPAFGFDGGERKRIESVGLQRRAVGRRGPKIG